MTVDITHLANVIMALGIILKPIKFLCNLLINMRKHLSKRGKIYGAEFYDGDELINIPQIVFDVKNINLPPDKVFLLIDKNNHNLIYEKRVQLNNNIIRYFFNLNEITTSELICKSMRKKYQIIVVFGNKQRKLALKNATNIISNLKKQSLKYWEKIMKVGQNV